MLRELALRAWEFAPTDGVHPTALPWVNVHRRVKPTPLGPRVIAPGLGVILSGTKRFTRDGVSHEFNAADWLVTASPTSTTCSVTRATSQEPYIALLVKLDERVVAGAMASTGGEAPASLSPAFMKSRVDDRLGDVLHRLMSASSADAAVLGPLLERELVHRLLSSEQGMLMRHLGASDRAILAVMRTIETRYAERLTMDDLARSIHLGVSSLHHRFKAATGTTPLQYLKSIRLREARRLLLEEQHDAATAAYAVGYVSASQFSRDYRRRFGAPPIRDIGRLLS